MEDTKTAMTEKEIKQLAKEIYPDNMGGMDQRGVDRYRSGFIKGYETALAKSEPVKPVEDDFIEYMKEARDQFVMALGNVERSNYLMTEVDSFLIAYDQMKERLSPLSPVPVKDETKTYVGPVKDLGTSSPFVGSKDVPVQSEVEEAAKEYAKDNYGDYESTSLENRIKISTARKAFTAGYSLAKSEPIKPDATDINVGHIESESVKICPETKLQCQGNKLQCNGYCWLQMGKQVKDVPVMQDHIPDLGNMGSI